MNATVELVKVTGVSPYSVYAGSTRYSFNKGVDSSAFQKGLTYSIVVKVGKNGGKYIDRVENCLGALDADVSTTTTPSLNPSTNQAPVFKKAWTPKANDSGLSKEEWAAKDIRISRSGVIQAAVQAVASHSSSVADLEAKAIVLAEAMLKFVNQTGE